MLVCKLENRRVKKINYVALIFFFFKISIHSPLKWNSENDLLGQYQRTRWKLDISFPLPFEAWYYKINHVSMYVKKLRVNSCHKSKWNNRCHILKSQAWTQTARLPCWLRSHKQLTNSCKETQKVCQPYFGPEEYTNTVQNSVNTESLLSQDELCGPLLCP